MSITSFFYLLFLASWKIWPFRRMTSKAIKALGIQVGKYYTDLWFTGKFTSMFMGNSLELMASKGDRSAMSVFWHGLDRGWDAVSLKVWCELARDAETIFDIGAHIGLYALVARKMNPAADIYAFEPGESSYKILKQNIQLNNMHIHSINMALGAHKENAVLHDLSTPTAAASLSKVEAVARDKKYRSYEVKVTTIEDFIVENNLPVPQLLSIDVEHHELQVLQGMGQLIRENKPDFIIEVLNNKAGEVIEVLFGDLDYHFYEIDEVRGLKKVEHLKNSETEQRIGFNFLICQKHREGRIGRFLRKEDI